MFEVSIKLLGVEVDTFDQEAPDARQAVGLVVERLVVASGKLFVEWQSQVVGAGYLGKLSTADFDYEARRTA